MSNLLASTSRYARFSRSVLSKRDIPEAQVNSRADIIVIMLFMCLRSCLPFLSCLHLCLVLPCFIVFRAIEKPERTVYLVTPKSLFCVSYLLLAYSWQSVGRPIEKGGETGRWEHTQCSCDFVEAM